MVLGTIVLIVAAYPFASIFTETYAQAVAMGDVLIGFLVGLVPFSVLFVLQRVFYSLSDTKTPFFLQVLQASIFVVLVLSCLLLPDGLVAVGIAVSLSLATGVQVIAAAVIIRRRLGGTGGGRIARSFARFLVAAVPSAAAGVLVYLGIQSLLGVDFLTSGYLTPLVSMAVIGVVMLAVYLGALALVRSPELADALGPVRARLNRSR